MRRAPSRANSSRLIVSWLRAASSVITLNMSRRSFLAGGGAPASFQHGQGGRYAAFSCQGSSTDFDDISEVRAWWSCGAGLLVVVVESAKKPVEVGLGVAPVERRRRLLVAALEGQQASFDLVQVGEVVGR